MLLVTVDKSTQSEQERDCYTHSEERTWQYLDLRKFHTHCWYLGVSGKIPAARRQDVKEASTFCVEPHGRFTPLFECFAIDDLLAMQTTKSVWPNLSFGWELTKRDR